MQKRFSFSCFNAAQFLGALNDQTYKLALIFFLIDLQGIAHSADILFWSSIVFVAPFLLFTAPGGFLADRCRKQRVIVVLKACEVGIMLLGFWAFSSKSAVGGYSALFLLASQSAFFGPSKYGIIPELVEDSKVSRANGLVTGATYLAVILGAFLAGRVASWSGRDPEIFGMVTMAIALLGFLASLGIEKTPQGKTKGKMHLFVFYEIYLTAKKAFGRRFLFTSMMASAYFLFVGAFVQLNIIPFAMTSLGLSDVGGVNLFLVTALGVGAGAFLAGRLSKKFIELGVVPLAALGIALCCFSLDISSANLPCVIALMLVIGLFGGLYVVPVDTFIQVGSFQLSRAENIAAANFLGFVGVLGASGLLVFNDKVLKMSPAGGFSLFGGLTLLMAVMLGIAYAPYLLRTLVKFLLSQYDVQVAGLHLAARSPDEGMLVSLRVEKKWHVLFLVKALPYAFQVVGPPALKVPFLRGLYLVPKHEREEKIYAEASKHHQVLIVFTGQKKRMPWENLPHYHASLRMGPGKEVYIQF